MANEITGLSIKTSLDPLVHVSVRMNKLLPCLGGYQLEFVCWNKNYIKHVRTTRKRT